MKLPCWILHTVETGQNQGSQHIDNLVSHSSFSNFIDPPRDEQSILILSSSSATLQAFYCCHTRFLLWHSKSANDDEIIHWDHKVGGLQWLWGDSLIIILPCITMTLGYFSTWITRKEFLNVIQLKKLIWNGNRRGSNKPKRPPCGALFFFLVKFWYWGSDNMICLCSPSLQHQSCWEQQSKAAGFQRS